VPLLFGPDFGAVTDVMPWLAVPFIANAAWLYLATAVSAEGRPGWAFRYRLAFNLVFWSSLIPLMRWNATLGLPITEALAAGCGLYLLRSLTSRSKSSVKFGDVIEPLVVAMVIIVIARVLASTVGVVAAGGIALVVMAVYWTVRYGKFAIHLARGFLGHQEYQQS
jgi:O-antigen/teichoic acid export membrane protein